MTALSGGGTNTMPISVIVLSAGADGIAVETNKGAPHAYRQAIIARRMQE